MKTKPKAFIRSRYHYDGLPVIVGTGEAPYPMWTTAVRRFDEITGQHYWSVYIQSTMYESALAHYQDMCGIFGYGQCALINLADPAHEKETVQ